ncbi:MAG TPA: DUF4214 domain-containing protein [Pyrinomonadaceae bacterium]|nr:DUF4214 domain-containing protein [Pyrinomonadaceae bacterium]
MRSQILSGRSVKILAGLSLLIFLSSFQDARAAIQVVNSSGGQTAVASTTLSWSHTVPAVSQQNRILVVCLSYRGATGPPANVTAATYGTQNFTAGNADATAEVGGSRALILYLPNPLPGTNNVSITFDQSLLIVGTSVLLTGVDQTTPRRATANTSGNSATPSLPSIGPVVLGDMIIDNLTTTGNRPRTAANAGQNVIIANRATGATAADVSHGVSNKVAASVTESVGWTLSATGNFIYIATAFAQAIPTASDSSISGRITATDGSPVSGATITLSGDRLTRAITDANGFYCFDGVAPGGFYTLTPSRANYSFSPSRRSFSLVADTADATFTATPDADRENPLDTSEYFVRQQYLDFLGREPDSGGFNYWSDQINQCGADASCKHQRRIDVSAAYFMSDEFQQTGSFVYRLYKAAYGVMPTYSQFIGDRGRVVMGGNLDESRTALSDDFVTRAAFRQAYPDSLTNTEFVNRLFESAGLAGNETERQSYVEMLNSGGTRSEVLRGIIENDAFKRRESNPSFVLMQYFGYLRRDADEGGLNFWMEVLNNRVPGNYRSMVCAFLTSSEYQRRFSSVITRSNAGCGQ